MTDTVDPLEAAQLAIDQLREECAAHKAIAENWLLAYTDLHDKYRKLKQEVRLLRATNAGSLHNI